MPLSRPATFPLLKLPWLCIKCVLHNSDLVDLIYFASLSNRTRRIVKSSNYPLKEIDIFPNSSCRRICMGDRRTWHFKHDKYRYGVPLVLERNSVPFRACRGFNPDGGHYLHSYTTGDELDALKMGIDFMIDLFGCKIGYLIIAGDKLSDFFGLGISTVKELFIKYPGPVDMTDLNYLLETVNVTDRYVFNVRISGDFYCDPRFFKCRKLYFGGEHSADWVTLELLCQFDVPQLTFFSHQFSVKDIVSYLTYWFNSENRKLEYLYVSCNNPVSLEYFKIDHLNPMTFCEKRRNRWTLNKSLNKTDMSSGKDILRQDGLLATFFVESKSVLFYIWHKRFPDAVVHT
ncbi:unnamed protein product [Caenorhabditis brenneri]